MLRSALLDIQVTLLCVCGVDSFIPELEHLIENLFHGLFSKNKPLKSHSWIQIPELKWTFLRNQDDSTMDLTELSVAMGSLLLLDQ